MEIQKIQSLFARHAGVKALGRLLQDTDDKRIHLAGLQASAAPMIFASLKRWPSPWFITKKLIEATV